MRRRKSPAPLTVEVVKDAVVLTMSRPRAHHMAMVINGARRREIWLDEATMAMLTAADRPDVRPGELYHRGAWLDASALVSRELLRSSGLMGVAQDIADHVLQFSHGSSVAIMVLSPDDPAVFEVRIAAGAGAAELVDRTLSRRGSLAGSAVDHDRGEFGTAADGESWDAGAAPAVGRRPVMAAPIHSGGRPCGAIVVHRRPGQAAFDATVLTMVEEFARQTSLALELATRRSEHDWRQERTKRNRAEHALYDSLLQRLFSIGMTVQSAETILRQGESSPTARQARDHLARAVDDLDVVIRDIRAVLQKGNAQQAEAAPATEHVVEHPVPEPEVAASLVHTAAVHAAERAEAAVETAAHRAAEAATTARDERSAAVQVAADAVAARVAAAAAAVKDEADIAALTVAQAAFDAALLIASSVAPGSERDAALTATLVATAVSSIAIKTAAVTAAARAEVAQEAAVAAAAAAVAATDAAKIVDLEVLCAAEAVRAVATQAASVLAEQTVAEATAFARARD